MMTIGIGISFVFALPLAIEYYFEDGGVCLSIYLGPFFIDFTWEERP